MGYRILIVEPVGYPHAKAFFEVAEWLQSALRRLGKDVFIGTHPESGRRNIVFGSNLLTLEAANLLPADSILYNLEQIYPGSRWLTPTLRQLFRRFEIWDYSHQNARAYPSCGLPSPKVVPLSYAAELERIVPADEDIDVLFYGSYNERRGRILDELRAAGLHVLQLFGVYGKDRDALIARSKLIVNIHCYQAQVFEIVRISYLLNNRRCVVCEHSLDYEGEEEFAGGIAFAAYDELVATCLKLSSSSAAQWRHQIAQSGHRIFCRRTLEDLRLALVPSVMQMQRSLSPYATE